MTFDEWWDRYSHELPNPEFVSRENHRLMLEQAYEAGYDEARNKWGD